MKRLLTPAWIVRHVVAVVLPVAFLTLGWWQISRALAGNTLSWAYAFEWPIFAGFVVFIWVREVRGTLGHGQSVSAASTTGATGQTTAGVRRPVRAPRAPAGIGEPDDPELAAYNHYLRWLNANPDARPGDYPGP